MSPETENDRICRDRARTVTFAEIKTDKFLKILW